MNLVLIAIFFFSGFATARESCSDASSIPKSVAVEQITFEKTANPPPSGLTKSFDAKINGQIANLRYKVFPATSQPKKGTVIYACGGPGFPCSTIRYPVIPSDYDVVEMDYLGIGLNSEYQAPKQMAIDSQAQAVAALAKQLHEPNLVIYGESFGTTVATAAASKLTHEKSEESAPQSRPQTRLKGIILEGVVGPGRQSDYTKGYLNASEIAWSTLSSKEQNNFTRSYSEFSKHVSAADKADMDTYLTMSLQSGTTVMAQKLKNFSINVSQFQKEAKMMATVYANFRNGPGRRLFQAAGCQITPNQTSLQEKKIFGGNVNANTIVTPGLCSCPLVEEKWDPNEYQIKDVPILYINGKQDPATPYQWAKESFDGQKNSNKLLLSPILGGHAETLTGSLVKCTSLIFDSAVKSDLSKLTHAKAILDQTGCSNVTFTTAPSAIQ